MALRSVLRQQAGHSPGRAGWAPSFPVSSGHVRRGAVFTRSTAGCYVNSTFLHISWAWRSQHGLTSPRGSTTICPQYRTPETSGNRNLVARTNDAADRRWKRARTAGPYINGRGEPPLRHHDHPASASSYSGNAFLRFFLHEIVVLLSSSSQLQHHTSLSFQVCHYRCP